MYHRVHQPECRLRNTSTNIDPGVLEKAEDLNGA